MHTIETNQQDTIIDVANTLNNVNFQIAELLRIKEELDARLNALLEHGDDGSKTYVVSKFKVTITSGYNYTLNKDEYELMGNRFPSCFNPVKKRVSYDLDKSIIKDCEKYGSAADLEIMSSVISKKPKKLHIKITAGL
jgi:hypothetical protein